MKNKIIVIFVCTLLTALGTIQVVGVMDNGQENTSFENNVKFYASDSSDDGITEFYNDISSENVILARSIIANTEKFYIVPPGQWINFDEEGNEQGSIPFGSFDALLCPSPTIQKWKVTAVKNVKYGTNASKPWDDFGDYVKPGNVLRTCRFYWFEDFTSSFLNYTSGGSNYSIVPTGLMGVTTPQHIPNDPVFCNVNHYLNFADCYYGDLEAVNHNCIIVSDGTVSLDYQPGYKGSFAEAFAPRIIEGPSPPNKPSTPEGATAGAPGHTYYYSTYTIDPNGDDVFYMYDWGDGTTSDWLGPYSHGQGINESHTWSKKGSFNVKVKAKDTFGTESSWSDSLPVKIPRVGPLNHPLLLRLLEKFPHAFPILRQLVGL